MPIIRHNPSPELIAAVCKPECVLLGPIIAPSINVRTPVHYSVRRLYSYPETLRVLGKEMGAIAAQCKPDAIAAVDMSGIPLATSISMQYDLPMVIVRKERKQPGVARCAVEGIVRPSARYALVDDGIIGGAAKIRSIAFLEETGGSVDDIVVWLDATDTMGGDYDLGRSELEKRTVRIHSFLTYTALFTNLHRTGTLSDALFAIIIDFIQNIKEWQTNEDKWRWFEDVMKKQNGKLV